MTVLQEKEDDLDCRQEAQHPGEIEIVEIISKTEKHQVYSTTGQVSYKLISSLTTPVKSDEKGLTRGAKTKKAYTDIKLQNHQSTG